MKLLNIRQGFACNSSSTHSIIFSDKKYRDTSEFEFGWNWFTASAEDSKRAWLGCQILSQLEAHGISDDNALAIVHSLLGEDVDLTGYVDHQSVISFPMSRRGVGLDLEFIKDFRDWLLNPKAVIFGGNDNEERDPLWDAETDINSHYWSLFVDHYLNVVARKDSGGYWTLFDKDDGTKVRVSFEKETLGVAAKKADTPELVDLKVTDYCTYDCKTCYQGSTRDGKHADKYVISSLLQEMGDAGVFEVAIGGGEPTLHPDFERIVQSCVDNGIVPNFTTRDPKWFQRFPNVVPLIGSVAVSCDDWNAVQKLSKTINDLAQPLRDELRERTVVQHILGLKPEYEVENILHDCRQSGLPCVLLGYKTTHRGATQNPHVPKGKTWGQWLVQKLSEDSDREWDNRRLPNSLGVDTVLAGELQGMVGDVRLTLQEGQFSCYVDAVEKKMYPSSFKLDQSVDVDPRTHGHSFSSAWRHITSYTPESSYVYEGDGVVRRLQVIH